MTTDDAPADPRTGLEPDRGLLERYLAGRCTEAEAATVRRWADAAKDRVDAGPALRESRDAIGQRAPVFDSRTAWQRIAGRVDADPRATAQASRGSGRLRGRAASSSRGAVIRAAAIVLIVIATTWTWVWRTGFPWRARGDMGSVAAARVYATPRGRRAEIELTDGTHVVLGPESQLRVPVGYARGHRDTHLVGEGYFVVRHDPSQPFAVYAGATVAKDVGTAFTLRAYPGEDHTQVVVASGEVVFGRATAPSTPAAIASAPRSLYPGDLARLTSAGGVTITRGIDVAHYTGWTHGELAFDDTPLRDVAADLTRWFDLDVRITDPALAARHVTILFPDPEPARVLGSLALALGAHYDRDGRVVTFSPGAP